jgi:inorganic pyrophosphatase
MAITKRPNPPETVYCEVEIPKGGKNKYEYDHDKKAFILDRVLHSTVFYPTEYGFIPNTLADDNDPLDIMVVSTFSTFPGCLIRARVIGALNISDTGEQDTKIIAIAPDDPRMEHIETLDDLAPHFKREIVDFWENYAKLQDDKEITIGDWVNRKKAYEIVNRALEQGKNNG